MTDQASLKAAIRQNMEAARAMTLRLLDLVPDEFFKRRIHDFYSPIGWHFGHIGMTEEYWVLCRALDRPPRDEQLSFLFANLPDNPKDNRVHLPSRNEVQAYLAFTRCDALVALEATDLDSPDPLVAYGYAWDFAFQHERQHQETICEMMQLISLEGEPAGDGHVRTAILGAREPRAVQIPAGSFLMGSDHPLAYDNEKRAHVVDVERFELDATPVSTSQWAQFMADGGYRRRELWRDEGWAWREKENATAPEYWRQGQGRTLRYCGPRGARTLDATEPLTSVSWYEADAYARWAGKRLPTEAEWEFAARFDPATGRCRTYPWGDEEPTSERACFGINEWQPAPVGDRPAGASPFGILDMAGGVWEWTASPFLPYPGFEAYPYDAYSKEHMYGNHYVCRGGSWATSAAILRSSFRNWYVPSYRQGFLGVRCAKDL